MNRSNLLVLAMWVSLSGCGEPDQRRQQAVQVAQLREGGSSCVENQCPSGLTCVRYGLGASEESRCVEPDAICSLLECSEGAQCFIFTSDPPLAVCATIQP